MYFPENNYEVSPLYGSLKDSRRRCSLRLPDPVAPDALVLQQEAASQGPQSVSYCQLSSRDLLDVSNIGRRSTTNSCLKTRRRKASAQKELFTLLATSWSAVIPPALVRVVR